MRKFITLLLLLFMAVAFAEKWGYGINFKPTSFSMLFPKGKSFVLPEVTITFNNTATLTKLGVGLEYPLRGNLYFKTGFFYTPHTAIKEIPLGLTFYKHFNSWFSIKLMTGKGLIINKTTDMELTNTNLILGCVFWD